MIVDVFPFFQELDLLEIRLNILSPVVDMFVAVESNYTFAGTEKPYLLEEHVSRYSQFPLVHHKIDQHQFREEPNPWVREFDHRRALQTALLPQSLDPGDCILMGDLDEVPDPNFIDGRTEARFHEKCYYFYLNWRSFPHRYGSVLYPAGFMKYQDYERVRSQGPGEVLEGCGWHWSSVGTESEVRAKMTSFSHFREFDLEQTMAHRSQLCDIRGSVCGVEPIDESFPTYLRENQDRYSHLIWPW